MGLKGLSRPTRDIALHRPNPEQDNGFKPTQYPARCPWHAGHIPIGTAIAPSSEAENGKHGEGGEIMAAPTSTDQVHRTPLEEARRSFDRGSAIFVDVRGNEEYQEAHIRGALNIPLSGPSEEYFSLPRDRDVILH